MNELAQPSDDESFSVQLSGVSFVVRQQTPIRALPGFTKTKHRIPDAYDRQSQGFVERLGSQLVRDDLDQTFTRLRDAFGFKRRDLQATESDEGFGTITTPHFLYSSCVFQSPEEIDEAVWQRDLSQITAPETLIEDACNRVFARTFNTVEFSPPAPIDLEKLIDHIEELPDDRVKADYDRNITFCNIIVKGSSAMICVTRDAFQIVHTEPSEPRLLVTSIRDVQRDLIDFAKLT